MMQYPDANTPTKRGSSTRTGELQPIHLCIGSARCGTTWLFNNIKDNEHLFVPAVKEVRYWWERPASEFRELSARRFDQTALDSEQFNWMSRWIRMGDKWSIEEYRDLMTVAGRPSLDISPSYCSMPKERIVVVREALPVNSKVLLFLRNPLHRELSLLKLHAFMHGHFRSELSNQTLYEFVSHERQRARGRYRDIVINWKESFGDRLGIFYYDDLTEDPAAFLETVTTFLGISAPADARAHVYYGTDRNQRGGGSIFPSFTKEQVGLIAEIALKDALDFSEIDQQMSSRWVDEIGEALIEPKLCAPQLRRGYVADSGYQNLLNMSECLSGPSRFVDFKSQEGIEEQSLFSRVTTSVKDLTRYLERGPAEIFVREHLQFHSEKQVIDVECGFVFGSCLSQLIGSPLGRERVSSRSDLDETYNREKAEIDFLSRRFWHYAKQKIGLYVTEGTADKWEDVLRLRGALQTLNPGNLLLYVTEGVDRKPDMLEGVYVAGIPAHLGGQEEFADWRSIFRELSDRQEFRSLAKSMFS